MTCMGILRNNIRSLVASCVKCDRQVRLNQHANICFYPISSLAKQANFHNRTFMFFQTSFQRYVMIHNLTQNRKNTFEINMI